MLDVIMNNQNERNSNIKGYAMKLSKNAKKMNKEIRNYSKWRLKIT